MTIEYTSLNEDRSNPFINFEKTLTIIFIEVIYLLENNLEWTFYKLNRNKEINFVLIIVKICFSS